MNSRTSMGSKPMDENTLRKALTEIAEEKVPVGPNPWTQLRRQSNISHQVVPYREQEMNYQTAANSRLRAARTLAMLVLALALVSTAVLLTPGGRVVAHQVLGFFARTEQVSFPLSSEEMAAAQQTLPVEATATPPETLMFFADACNSGEPETAYPCQIALAQEQAGMQLLLPDLESSGLYFSSLAFDTARGSVQASFGYEGHPESDHSVWIFQGEGTLPVESVWQSVPEQYVYPVAVMGSPAEYVEGAFVTQPGATEAVWIEQGPMARLRWQQGPHWFEIVKLAQSATDTSANQAWMINLAESVTTIVPVD